MQTIPLMYRRLNFLIAPLAVLAIAASQASCVVDVAGDESDLTSVTARERVMTFEGYVYVLPTASASQILTAVRSQTRSAFGALLVSNVAVASRELATVDAKSFIK